MKLSYHQACTMGNSDLEMDVELSERVGYEYIELVGGKIHEYLENHTLDDLFALFSGKRIKPHAINGFQLYDGFLLNNDNEERCKALCDEIVFCCDIGNRINARTLVVNPPKNSFESQKPYNKPWKTILEESTEMLEKLCKMVAAYGMNIGLEMVGSNRSSIRTITHATEIINLIESDNIGYVLDPYNLYTYCKTGDFDDISQIEADRILAVHINGAEKDLPIEALCKENRTLCDRGVMNVAGYLYNLKKTGYKGPVSIEIFREDFWRKTAEWVINETYKTTKAFMKRCGVL